MKVSVWIWSGKSVTEVMCVTSCMSPDTSWLEPSASSDCASWTCKKQFLFWTVHVWILLITLDYVWQRVVLATVAMYLHPHMSSLQCMLLLQLLGKMKLKRVPLGHNSSLLSLLCLEQDTQDRVAYLYYFSGFLNQAAGFQPSKFLQGFSVCTGLCMSSYHAYHWTLLCP